MISKNYFERICERMSINEESNLGQRCAFFFTGKWPYEEVNKFLEECDIEYHWSDNRAYLSISWSNLSIKKIKEKIKIEELQRDF